MIILEGEITQSLQCVFDFSFLLLHIFLFNFCSSLTSCELKCKLSFNLIAEELPFLCSKSFTMPAFSNTKDYSFIVFGNTEYYNYYYCLW